MKKIFSLLMVAGALTFTACGGGASENIENEMDSTANALLDDLDAAMDSDDASADADAGADAGATDTTAAAGMVAHVCNADCTPEACALKCGEEGHTCSDACHADAGADHEHGEGEHDHDHAETPAEG